MAADKSILNIDRVNELLEQLSDDHMWKVIGSQLVADLTRIEDHEFARALVECVEGAFHKDHLMTDEDYDRFIEEQEPADDDIPFKDVEGADNPRADGGSGVSGGRAEAGGTEVGHG